MKKRKTFIGMALVLAILILGVGYAAISNINLNITGTANVNANADFKVEFDKNHQIAIEGGTTEANAAYTDTLSATMTVSLDSATKTQSATYKIDNKSSELSATLNAVVTNEDTETAQSHMWSILSSEGVLYNIFNNYDEYEITKVLAHHIENEFIKENLNMKLTYLKVFQI